MSTKRPITTSFPLGLFCQATISGPLPTIPHENASSPSLETQSTDRPQQPEETAIGLNGANEDNHWDDEVA